MTDRTRRLRQESLEAVPSISAERALLVTAFYEENFGRLSTPVLRARTFLHLCENKTLHHGDGELIVGERGPEPKAVPTFPELTCHSVEDLRILDSRPKTRYSVPDAAIADYESAVIPFWTGRSLRDRLFAALPDEWHHAYEAGVFTEFMEQR
ncbi:MAG: formate C-acetyltransferase/glycerol dehydratase family glycyl radical enzyme, partial [Gemmatimonadetes bacterium]|nr:formate C-acetyltransferase/glycerol dehydratase family glycyl radical enzyme [Gemmatimonadota bacterium]